MSNTLVPKEFDIVSEMEDSEDASVHSRELSVSFGLQCSIAIPIFSDTEADEIPFSSGAMKEKTRLKLSSSFSCLSGAALSANATLANTNICNGIIGEEILPSLDSPRSFRRMTSSPSFSRLDLGSSSSSSHSCQATLGVGAPTCSDLSEIERNMSRSMSIPTGMESPNYLDAMELQMAGGAAGEDRVQAVCSEGQGWLLCTIYDGFNGRDAADFLAGTFYETISFYLHMLDLNKNKSGSFENMTVGGVSRNISTVPTNVRCKQTYVSHFDVIGCLNNALAQSESDFMHMVEQEMEDRPDLVSVGSCVLVALLYGDDIYVLNLGDSRAILATNCMEEDGLLKAIQLTESHTVDNELEYKKFLASHPEDPRPIVYGRVKGKLKLTRAFGVGYLKKSTMNDVLMGILRVRDLSSPPYIGTEPFTMAHRVSEKDQFVVLGSDGLFDFFSNDEVVHLVHLFLHHNPSGDPAKHLIEQLVQRAAGNAGFSAEDLMRIPAGRRRKYHDDVTVIVVILGNKQRTSSASTTL